MVEYKPKVNPFTGQLQLVPTNIVLAFKEGVATQVDLPLTGNAKGDARIANDTGHLYVWSIDESSGLLTDWVDAGDIVDLTWAAISGKPSSAVADIDDAVTKRHSQNTDEKIIKDNTSIEITDNGVDAGYITLKTDNNTLVTFKSGRVGIGEITPNAKLEVRTINGGDCQIWANESGYYSGEFFIAANGQGILELYDGASSPNVKVRLSGHPSLTNLFKYAIELAEGALLENKKNSVVGAGINIVDSFADTLGKACVWHYVIQKGANLRAGTITACWDATGNVVKYNETHTEDIGDTSIISLSIDIDSNNVRFLATGESGESGWRVAVIRNLIF